MDAFGTCENPEIFADQRVNPAFLAVTLLGSILPK